MAFERQKMNERVMQDLKKRSTIGLPFYILLAFIAVFAGSFYERHPRLSAGFLLLMGSVCLFRLVHLVISGKGGERYTAVHKNVFFASVVATALIWGVTLALVMLQAGEYAAQTLMTVCVCGLCAGGVVAFIPHRPISVMFNLSILMPATIVMFVTDSHIGLAMMFLLFSAYMVLIAYRGNLEYWGALENEYLLEVKSSELVRLSNTDVLTGLYNRRYFDEEFDKEWKRSGRSGTVLSVILLDIDHFKNINDTFGHQIGDEYLRRTAAALNSVFRRDYDVVARYGGEEFIVLLPGINAEQARRLAEKVKQKMESLTIDHQGQPVRTTISAGIMSCVPDFNVRADAVISGADKALYEAKQSGRDRVAVFSSSSAVGDVCDSCRAK